jgi:hypothetical protein
MGVDAYQGFESIEDRHQIAAMMQGSLSINQPIYVGEVGAHFFETYKKATGGITPVVYN